MIDDTNGVHDVCVVGGAGHVGAPLAVVLAAKGLRTLVYDLNRQTMGEMASGRMPFTEAGGEEMLRVALASGRLAFTAEPHGIQRSQYVVVTIGTPIDEYHNPRLHVVTRAFEVFLPFLRDGQTIILRSTVFPGVTDYLHRWLIDRGKKVLIAFCPERVVQGQGIKEIQTLTQIVSGTTPEAEESAVRLFERIAPRLVRMVPKEAEFAKLICNAYRYIQFAAANQFYMMAESAGLDYDRILRGVKQEYPRARDLPGPGFAAGPCLMKDTMQLFAFSNNQFALGQAAMSINEGLPNYVVDKIRRTRDLAQTRVGILGMAFKADVDDIRDSLAYKIGKILRFHGAKVLYSDEFAADATFVSKEELIAGSDVVIVGVPHSSYGHLKFPPGMDVINLWNIGKGGG
jgi:UDP-N-acetyl-D-mannosaminuronic acid dehydrogenase